MGDYCKVLVSNYAGHSVMVSGDVMDYIEGDLFQRMRALLDGLGIEERVRPVAHPVALYIISADELDEVTVENGQLFVRGVPEAMSDLSAVEVALCRRV